MLMSQDSSDHWSTHAKQWESVKPPLRPGHADVNTARDMVNRHWQPLNDEPLQALLLGVTPELVQMDWPCCTQLRTVERNQSMIDYVLPENSHLSLETICANWLDLPVKSQSLDCVLGDGCFTVLGNYQTQLALCKEIRRVLNSTGHFIIRLFVKPAKSETVEQVFDDLLNLNIGNFHIFKWRLAMALHVSWEQGISVNTIWKTWHESGISAQDLSLRTGWPIDEILTIEAYRGSSAQYSFPTLAQMRELFELHFQELQCHIPQYELGDRCPTLLLTPRP